MPQIRFTILALYKLVCVYSISMYAYASLSYLCLLDTWVDESLTLVVVYSRIQVTTIKFGIWSQNVKIRLHFTCNA